MVGDPREPDKQAAEECHVQGQRDDDSEYRGQRCRRSAASEPDPVQKRPRDRRGNAGHRNRREADETEPGKDADVLHSADHDVSDLHVLMPHNSDRVPQRVDPCQPGQQQTDQADQADTDLRVADTGDVQLVRKPR